MKLDAETMSYINACCKAAEECGYIVEKPLTDSQSDVLVSENHDMAITINEQYYIIVVLNSSKYRSPIKRKIVEMELKKAFLKALQVDSSSMDMVVLLAGEIPQSVIKNFTLAFTCQH